MRQIERYVMVELLRVFGVLITISTVLFVFVGAFSEAQKRGVGAGQVVQILPYLIPSLMPYTIPATLLLSVCVVYGRMSGDSEIIAVRAAGIHIMHLMWPAFFVAASLSVASLILTDQIAPWSYRKIEEVIASAFEDIFLDKLRAENTFSYKGITINVTRVEGRVLIEPTIRYTPENGKPATIRAKRAHIEFELRKHRVWLTFHEMYANFSGKSQLYSKFERRPYPLPELLKNSENRSLRTQDLMAKLAGHRKNQTNYRQRAAVEASFALLRGDFDYLNGQPFPAYKQLDIDEEGQIRELRTEYFTRFSMSVSGFFVVLAGTPFSVLMAKRQFLTSFLFCFLPILTVYYPIAMMTQNLSKSGQLEPSIAAWVANGVLLIAAGYNLRRVMRN